MVATARCKKEKYISETTVNFSTYFLSCLENVRDDHFDEEMLLKLF